MTRHELKTWPEFFDAVRDGRKTFEVRYNDRGFQTGDLLVLRKWDPRTEVYGEYVEPPSVSAPLHRRVTYVLSGFGIEPGYVVMGLEEAVTTKRSTAVYELHEPSAEAQAHISSGRFKRLLTNLFVRREAKDLPESVEALTCKDLKVLWCKISEESRRELEDWIGQLTATYDVDDQWVRALQRWVCASEASEVAKPMEVLGWDSEPEGAVATKQERQGPSIPYLGSFGNPAVHGASERFKSMLSGLLAQDSVPEDAKARCSRDLKDLWREIPEDGRDELEEWFSQSILDRDERWVWEIRRWMGVIGPDEEAAERPEHDVGIRIWMESISLQTAWGWLRALDENRSPWPEIGLGPGGVDGDPGLVKIRDALRARVLVRDDGTDDPWVSRYRRLERALLFLRNKTGKADPEGAAALLDEMEALWWKLTEAEREMLNSESPQTWPLKPGESGEGK
jgi:hypothetical protein